MWPSLVALVGTVAVVVALLVAFGDRLSDSEGDEQTVAGDTDDGAEDPAAGPTDGAADGGGAADGSGSEDDAGEETGEESGDGSGDDSGDDSGDGEEREPSVTTAAPEDREPIGVLNGSSTSGVATEAQEVFQDGGWEVPAVASYAETVDVSIVYYPDGMEDAAEALMAQFPEIAESAPTIEGLNASRLVVIVGEDYVAAAESSS